MTCLDDSTVQCICEVPILSHTIQLVSTPTRRTNYLYGYLNNSVFLGLDIQTNNSVSWFGIQIIMFLCTTLKYVID